MLQTVTYQPAITPWGHAWRVALVLVISAALFGGAFTDGAFTDRSWLMAVDLALALSAFVAMCFRRRFPLPIAIAISALTALSATAGGPAALAMTSLATRRIPREIVAAVLVNLTAGAVYAVTLSGSGIEGPRELRGIVVPVAAMVGWGLFVGSNREVMWNLRLRAERAEAEQELRSAEARAAERTRIAREMHDVVAHRISHVSMRASALVFRDDLSAAQLREESKVIRDAANDALRDLRSVLEVLRDPVNSALLDPPQPTYADIADLVADARRHGAHIEFDDAVIAAIPDETGRVLYRVVQEGITNASKHAPGATLRVRLFEDAGGVALAMANSLGFGPAPARGAGLGLIGISERVAILGGRFEHAQGDTEFTFHAWLPCRPGGQPSR